jgi:hypothetical protein
VNRYARVMTVAEMQGRDLLRRRLALVILVALPLAFYFATLASSDGSREGEDLMAVGGAALGLAWSVAGAALFAILAARRVDPRLVQAGFRPWELLLGRLLLFESLAVVMMAGFSALAIPLSAPERPAVLLLAVALETVVAVPLGLMVATLLPRELEGTLAIIGIVGIEMSVPSNSGLASVLPLYGPLKLIEAALGSADALAPAVLHGAGYAAALFLISAALWTRRVRPRMLG